jgi:hypothetical protein
MGCGGSKGGKAGARGMCFSVWMLLFVFVQALPKELHRRQATLFF